MDKYLFNHNRGNAVWEIACVLSTLNVIYKTHRFLYFFISYIPIAVFMW